MRKFGSLEAWKYSFRGEASPHTLLLSFKREDDGREGAISGRLLARKATGVSPSGFSVETITPPNL